MTKALWVLPALCVLLTVSSCNGQRGASNDADLGGAVAGMNVTPGAVPTATVAEPLLVKDRMVLETIINDYLMRRKAKGEFAALFPFEFDYWTNAIPSNSPIIVYIYARPPVDPTDPRYPRLEAKMRAMFDDLSLEIRDGLKSAIFSFPEFAGEDRRGINVVLRIEPRAEDTLRELLLSTPAPRN